MTQSPAPNPAGRPDKQERYAAALRPMVTADHSVRRRQMARLLHAVIMQGEKP